MKGVSIFRDRSSILLVLASLSGVCGIAYEVLYVRQIGIAIGDVWYVALAVMMSLFAGMALGALAGRRCLRWLPAAEALLGVHALAMAAWSATGMHIPAFVPPEFVAHPLGGVLLTVVVMTPAAVLMGLGIALFGLWRAAAGDGVQRGFAGAYLAYNAGAAAGLLAVAFYLIPGIGVALTLAALATLNGVVALALWRVGLPPGTAPAVDEPIGWREPMRLAVVGIAGALVQSICLKVAYLALGPHPAQYALTLALALAAIAVGTVVVERFRIGFNRWLVLSLFMVGVPFFLTGIGLPIFAAAPSGAGVWIWAGWTALPLIAVGGTVAAWVRSSVASGSTPGTAIAAVAGGNAVGYALVMLVIEPFFVDAVLVALPLVLLAAGLIQGLPAWRPALAGTVPVAVLVIGLGAAWPSDALHWSAQAIRNADTFAHYRDTVESTTTYNDWGRSATITRLEEKRHLSMRGYHSMGIQLAPDPREGMVPIVQASESDVGMTARAMAGDDGSALVVGLGAGLTASVTEALFDRLDVVEINPAMGDVVDAFSDLNWDFPSEETTRILWRDGLMHLRRTDRTYDAIINTSTSPANGSSTKLFTRETVRAARDRLNAGGVYVTWLDSRLPKTEAHSLIRTVESVFPSCAYRLLTPGYMLVICSAETDTPRAFDLGTWPEHVRARIPGLNDRHRAKFMAAQTFSDAPDFLRPPDGPVPLNTLDRPTVGVEAGFQWGLWKLRPSLRYMASPSPLLQPDGTVMQGDNRCPAMLARGIPAWQCRNRADAS